MVTFRILAAVLVAAALVGCSSNDNSRSSTLVSVFVQAGQEDIDGGVLRVAAIQDSGLPNLDAELRLTSTDYITDATGSARVTVTRGRMTLAQLVAREANTDRNQAATTSRCQWVGGCGSVAFGEPVEVSAYEWRSVAYDLNRNERIRVTPFTELAAALAFAYVYAEDASPAAEWQATGFYSPYSIEQAISQVSGIIGVQNVQTTAAADLTRLNTLSRVAAVTARDRIRYGALLAAWAHLEASAAGFTESAVAEFLDHKGQVRQQGGTEVLTLQNLFSAARTNLAALTTVTNATVQGYVDDVIADFDQQIAALVDGELTDVVPATLDSLFGTTAYNSYVLGIKRTKAFINELRDNIPAISDTDNYASVFFKQFFNEGYKDKLDDYADFLKDIGETHRDNLNTLIQAFRETQQLYLDTYLAANNTCAAFGVYPWVTACVYSEGTMSLNGGAITVTQAVGNVTGSTTAPVASRAIDVLIRGTYQIGDLRLIVNPVYRNNTEADGILSPSGVRMYYTDAVSELVDPAGNEILAYEMRWSDFALYDSTVVGSSEETELTGSFRILFRGVADPEGVTERRFNIDEVVLNSRISDKVGDNSENDTEFSTVFVSSRSSNSRYHYPEYEFSGFKGFFTPQAAIPEGTTVPDLVHYALGQETVRDQLVMYFDFLVPAGESRRYRFYPTVKRADALDVDRDGNRTELIDSHDFEICSLSDATTGRTVTQCNPRQRLYTARNVQQAINDLWEAGVFSRVSINGEGEYFVEWPASLQNGCYELEPLQADDSFAGVLHKPAMMGLDTLRFTYDIRLKDQPRTLLDVLVSAKSADRYSITAGLSHDFTTLNTGTVITGSGSNLDRLILSVDTDSSLRANASLAIFKSGVALQLDDGTTSTINSELIAAARELYDPTPLPYRYVTGKDGGYDLCVLDNAPAAATQPSIKNMVFSLTFRGVVYGSIRNENGIWLVRYLDGQFETL